MKFILIAVVAVQALCAQAPAVQAPQAAESKPAAEVSPDTVVAVVNGRKMTSEEVKNMVVNLLPQLQQAFANNPQQFMREYAWYMLVQGVAEKTGLDKKTPYKERLEFHKMMTLVQAMFDQALTDVIVTRDEERAYYEANQLKYKEVQAKLIYIPFGAGGATPAGGKKVLTEAEAKAKAESVARQAKAGADFVKLVKENSEDPGSVSQNGDIGAGIRSTTTHIPEAMRNAILALTAGQVSDAIRHDNGYYVFRAESVGVLPYEKVREEIYKELKQTGFRKWQQKTQSESAIQFANEEFFRNFAKDVQQQQPK
jgi:peptidyl-prolyl cis-trans isomerase C